MARVPPGYADLRRDEIVAGARACFARLGYRGTTVSDLEEATQLTRGTIFRYFSSKAEIFGEVCIDEDRRLREGYEASAAAGSHDYHSLEGLVRAVLIHQVHRASEDPAGLRVRLELISLAESDPDLALVVHQLEHDRRAWRRRIVERASDAGLIPHDWTVDQVTDLISLAAVGLGVEISYQLPRHHSHEAMVDLVTAVVLAGLQAEPPAALLPPVGARG